MNRSPYLPINYILAGWQSNFDKNHTREYRPPICSSPQVKISKISPIMVEIDDPYNVKDPLTGYGSVEYEYEIGKYLITIGEYIEFLNSIASKSDPNGVYNSNMATDKLMAGISKTFICDKYVYKAITPSGMQVVGANSLTERPIANLNWFSAARFVNWLANGQPFGTQNPSTTENGAYNLINSNYSFVIPRNKINPNTGEVPTFFLPTENEWYKAAYYNGNGIYNLYATQSDDIPGNEIGSKYNQINYISSNGNMSVTQNNIIESSQNYTTNVGAYLKNKSYFGTFDQTGNLWEFLDPEMPNKTQNLRGGAWTSFYSQSSSKYSLSLGANEMGPNGGFRIASYKKPFPKIVLNMLPVGDINNKADAVTELGKVIYQYKISQNFITIGQYVVFLNSVAKRDDNNLYNENMETDLTVAGITRTGHSGNYKYSVMNNYGNSENKPITYVDWVTASRFANWMSNGQPFGNQDNATTENGSYNLANFSQNLTVIRNEINPNTGMVPLYFIPSNNELYKASFYSPMLNNGNGGYYKYATQSNNAPSNNLTPETAVNCVNYVKGVNYCVTQSAYLNDFQNYLTDVGFFSNSKSYYGVYDLNGLVYNMFEFEETGKKYGIRGGFWAGGVSSLNKNASASVSLSYLGNDTGFRLISI